MTLCTSDQVLGAVPARTNETNQYRETATAATPLVAVSVSWEGTWEIGHAQVLCRAKDVAAFEELGFGEQEYWKGLPEGVSFLVDEEANYGNSSALRELAERGYVFIAQHDAGGDYDAGRLVSDGKTFREVDAMVHEPRPCVAVDANGFVDKKQLQAVRKYWRAVARAKQKLGFAEEEM
jgi:hypothetical protein